MGYSPPKELEIILSRHFADCMSVPIFITDTEGNLLFYNEPAEDILGRKFEDTGPMPVDEWSSIFKPEDEEGRPLPPEGLPLVRTIGSRKPDQGSFWIESLLGGRYLLNVTSLPIIGRAGNYMGAMAIFWSNDAE